MTARDPIKINGTLLPNAEIAEEAQHHPAKTPAAAFDAAARALVIRHLLLEEAKRCAIAVVPVEVSPGKRETRDDACIRALIESNVPEYEADETECRAFYEANRARLCSLTSQTDVHSEPPPFEYVHEKIAAYLAERAWRQDTAKYIDHLVARAQIEGLSMQISPKETD